MVPLDDFNLLLGIDIMKKFKVASIPHLAGLTFMRKNDPEFVKVFDPLMWKDEETLWNYCYVVYCDF